MRILMIEDEYLVAEEIRLCLNDGGFCEVEHAATQDEALKYISGAAWDAAVLDANLDGRGVDAIAAALTEGGIPFVIVTGYNPKSLPERFSGVPVVEKPFRSKALANTLSRLFAK